jgi:hypothetical protein
MSIFNPQNQMARPLSGSVLPNYSPIQGGRSRSPLYQGQIQRHGVVQSDTMGEYFVNAAVQGLGSSAAPGEVPWQCWGIQAFQDCHAAQWAAAQKDCQANAAQYGMSVDDCTTAFSAANDGSICVPQNCNQYAAISNQTTALSAATVKQAQTALNADLSRNGYKTITVDGKLGPATCGAASYLYNTSPRQSTVWTDYNLYAYCTNIARTNPTLVGQNKPLTTFVAPQINIVQGQQVAASITHQWGQADTDMPALQAQINAILSSNGYNAIPLTGVLDAATCGAMKWIGDNTGQNLLTLNGQNCQAFTMPTKKATLATRPKGSPPPPGMPTAPTPPGTHPISSATMLMGGLALLAVGGGYYYMKKKGMV